MTDDLTCIHMSLEKIWKILKKNKKEVKIICNQHLAVTRVDILVFAFYFYLTVYKQ